MTKKQKIIIIKAKKFPMFVKCRCGADMFKFTRILKGKAKFMCSRTPNCKYAVNGISAIAEITRQINK